MADCAIYIVWHPERQEALMEDRPDLIRQGLKPPYHVYPGGKVEPGESYEQAMVREFREELGAEPLAWFQLMDPFVNHDTGWIVAPFVVTLWEGDLPATTFGDRQAQLFWMDPTVIALLPVEPESARVQIAQALIHRMFESGD